MYPRRYISMLILAPQQVFANLKQPLKDFEQREREVNERIHAQYEKSQARQTELV